MKKKFFIWMFFLSVFFVFSFSSSAYSGDMLETLPSSVTSTGTQEQIVDIPNISITFQNPSYILPQGNSADEYLCDSSKPECKVNFNLEETFGGYIPTKYACRNDFGFVSGEENKCNPNTIIFPYGEHQVSFSIYEKENPSNVQEKFIRIIHTPSFIPVPTPVIEIQSGLEFKSEHYICKSKQCSVNFTTESSFIDTPGESCFICEWDFGQGVFETLGTENTCNPGYVSFPPGRHDVSVKIRDTQHPENYTLSSLSFENTFSSPEQSSSTGSQEQSDGEIPDIIFTLQNPSYVSESSTEPGEYICDSTKPECKVNLSLEETFGGYVPTRFGCRIDAGFSTGQEDTCNPSTITFPIGQHKIVLSIFEKENRENTKTKEIYISNNGYISNSGGMSSGANSQGDTSNPQRSIIVQSGGIANGNYLECNEELCKVNLKFQNKSYESCQWDFGNANFRERYTTSCNPGILSFLSGKHRVELKLLNHKTQTQEAYFFEVSNIYASEKMLHNTSPKAVIGLQGILGKSKQMRGKKSIICYTDDECSINFTASGSYDSDGDTLDYFWDFGNTLTANTKNPGAQKYSFGKHQATLTVSDTFSQSKDIFSIEVLRKGQIPSGDIDENLPKYLRISSFLPNPHSRDENEWIELKNTGINILYLKGLIIQDNKKSFRVEEDIILLPYAKKKLYKSYTKLNLENSGDTLYLYYNEHLIDELSRNFQVREAFVITRESLLIDSQKVRVIEVIDGDTVVIEFGDGKKEKVRLIGVDTPETKHPKKIVEFFGQEASAYTKKSLLGKEVWLEIEKENYRDKYGRLLGYIRFSQSEKSFNQILIEEGYARAYLYFPFKYSLDFEMSQKEAKKSKRGMWADKEMIQEIQLLENLESELIIENIPEGDIFFALQKLYEVLGFESVGDIKKATFLAPYVLRYYEWHTEAPKSKTLLTKKQKQPKISQVKAPKVAFTLSVKLLKSGVKVSGKTQSGALVKISFASGEFEVLSGSDGKYTFLLDEDFTPGEQKVTVSIFDRYGNMLKSKERNIMLTPQYIREVALKKYKKTLAAGKKSKKGSKKSSIKQKKLSYSQKTSKNFSAPQGHIIDHDRVLLYIFCVLGIIIGFFSFFTYKNRNTL